jgi:hypothetical protein
MFCGGAAMVLFADDNFGVYEGTGDLDVREFYFRNAKRSVWKKCSICGKRVKLLPQYDKCDRCCTILENGGDPY